MAKASVTLPDGFLERLARLGSRTDEIAEKMLKAGGGAVLPKVRSNLSAVAGKGTKYESRSTGELERSLGLSPVKIDKNGNFNIHIGFAEPRSGGKRNAEIAAILEYGKHGQPAKPFMKPAGRAAKDAVVEAMKRTFEEETGKV